MTPFVFRLIQIVLIFIILALVGLGVLFYLRYESAVNLNNTEVEAKMLRLQSSAKVYYGRLGYYDGVCKDIGLPTGYTCRDSATTFVIYTKLSDESWYCADSDNYIGSVPVIFSHQKWCAK